jgi:hypothetical protein
MAYNFLDFTPSSLFQCWSWLAVVTINVTKFTSSQYLEEYYSHVFLSKVQSREDNAFDDEKNHNGF